MPEEVLGKPILEKVPGELRVKSMLQVLGGVRGKQMSEDAGCIVGTWSQFKEKANNYACFNQLVVPFQSHFD